MPKTYTYTPKQVTELTKAFKSAKTAGAIYRIHIVLLRAQGVKVPEVMKIMHCGSTAITRLTKLYLTEGIESLYTTKRTGHHRYLDAEDEIAFLAQFIEKANRGQIITVVEMHQRYEQVVGHKTNLHAFYQLLARHGWRKLMPRPHHPKQADAETIAASKKLTLKSQT